MCQRPSYLAVYDAYVHVSRSGMDRAVSRHVDALQSRSLMVRRATLAHLEKAILTQTRFAHVTTHTLGKVRRARQLAHIGATHRLRILQRRVVRHLWRPNSRLVARDRRRCRNALRAIGTLPTPTPSPRRG